MTGITTKALEEKQLDKLQLNVFGRPQKGGGGSRKPFPRALVLASWLPERDGQSFPISTRWSIRVLPI